MNEAADAAGEASEALGGIEFFGGSATPAVSRDRVAPGVTRLGAGLRPVDGKLRRKSHDVEEAGDESSDAVRRHELPDDLSFRRDFEDAAGLRLHDQRASVREAMGRAEGLRRRL